jgi:photosystem II stability/assembly factor-like uncharacterized protein
MRGWLRLNSRAALLPVLLVFLSSQMFRPTIANQSRPNASSDPTDQNRSSISEAREILSGMPLRFEPNHGQLESRVKYLARGPNYNVFLTGTEAMLDLRDDPSEPDRDAGGGARSARRIVGSQSEPLRFKLVGANPHATPEGIDELPGKTNYFIGKDPARWRADVPNYSRVISRDVYAGVDVIYYGKGDRLEYDFKLAVGADPNAPRLRFDGASNLRMDESGDLQIETGAGEVRQHKPIAYQLSSGIRREVEARYVVIGKQEVRFAIGQYDKRLPLVIDPVISYSTYFGGHAEDRVSGIAVDASGSAYITGTTWSSDLPLKDAAQTSHFSPYSDVFVSKLNASGTELVYSTFLGGSGFDDGYAIAVDQAGNAYVTGATSSADFPTTEGAFKSLRGPNFFNAFVAKLSPDGHALSYSTYLGGDEEGYNTGNSVAVDSLGNAYVTGFAGSPDFPTTPGAVQRVHGLSTDAFVTKLNADGTALVYSTYLGGNDSDLGFGIAVDAVGSAYVTGSSRSTDFPVTSGAFQQVAGQDSKTPNYLGDAFVTKLNPNGSSLVYSTYIGGFRADVGSAIAIDATGNAYIAGSTLSPDFPTTRGSLRREFGGGFYQSANRGRDWTINNGGLPAPTLYDFAVDPKNPLNLYLATVEGLYKSGDGGQSWTKGKQSAVLTQLVIDPLNPSTLYGGSDGVYKSTDGGLTFQPAQNGLPGLYVRQLVINRVNPSRLYVIGSPGFGDVSRTPAAAAPAATPPVGFYFFESSDAGATWQSVVAFSTQVPTSLLIDPLNPSRLFVVASGLLYRSEDGGAQWQRMSDQVLNGLLAVDPNVSGTIYELESSLRRSTDDGRTWRDISTGLPNPVNARSLLAVPTTPTTLYIGTDDGIFRSLDGGVTWRPMDITGPVAFLGFNPQDPSKVFTGINDPGDAFIAKLNPTGSALVYSTYLGENSGDSAVAIALDALGEAYVAGSTSSSRFPTQNALQADKPRSVSYNGFLAKLNADGSGLRFSTYFGGTTRTTTCTAVSTNSAGEVYVAGATAAGDLPTAGALQATFSGEIDGFVFKLRAPRVISASVSGKRLIVEGENFDKGATVLVNGEEQKTKNDDANPVTRLICKKAGKNLPTGAGIRVRNADGILSGEISVAPPAR